MNRYFKRIGSLVLALCLLCGTASALAEPVSAAFWPDDRPYLSDMELCGGALYLLADKALYRLQSGETEPSSFLEGLNISYYPDDTDPDTSALPNVSLLFAKDGCLYGLGATTGQVWRLTDESGSPVTEAVFTLNMTPAEGDEPYFGSVLYQDGTLFLCNMNDESLWKIALENGAQPQKTSLEALNSAILFENGLLLCAMRPVYDRENPTPMSLTTYDPATEKTELLYQTEDMEYNASLAFDPESRTVYYSSDYAVKAVNLDDMTCTIAAYLPQQCASSGLNCLPDGTLAIHCYSDTYLRTPATGDIADQVLFIYGEYGSEAHLAVTREHPEMTVSAARIGDSAQDLTSVLVSGATDVDVLNLTLGGNSVEKLIDKGYIADLSTYPEIMTLADQMNPSFLEPFQRDGKLYGLPISVNADMFFVDTAVWTETLGLSLDELPATYEDFLDFIANYTYDYGEDYPEVALIDCWDLRRELTNAILRAQIAAQMAAGETVVNFDTPAFRSLLKQLDDIDYSDISLSELLGRNATDDDYTEFYSKQMVFTLGWDNGANPSRFESSANPRPLVLTLEEGTDPVVPATLGVLTIYARSPHPEQAAAYIASYVSHLSAANEAVTLFPNRNDAVPDPNYETTLKDARDWLANRERALANALPENKAVIQEDIKWAQKNVTALEGNRNLVSAEAIAAYRQALGNYLYPLRQTPLTSYDDSSNSISALIEQYVASAIDADGFVKELSSRVRLMQLEDD